MVDYLKANPYVSMEEYKWGISAPMIRIMSADHTHVVYLTEKERERRNATTFDGTNTEVLNDLGIPVFGMNNNND